MKLKIFFSILVSLIFISNSFSQVFVNQAGYKTSLQKYFYTNYPATSFEVVEEISGNVFYSGQLTLISSNDPATGMQIRKGDFSNLTREGKYYIRLNTNDTSYHFNISSNVFNDVFQKALKAFYFQRCGSQLFYTHAEFIKEMLVTQAMLSITHQPVRVDLNFHEVVGTMLVIMENMLSMLEFLSQLSS
jgi:hypothetical protein